MVVGTRSESQHLTYLKTFAMVSFTINIFIILQQFLVISSDFPNDLPGIPLLLIFFCLMLSIKNIF